MEDTVPALFFSASGPFKDGPGGDVGSPGYVPAPSTGLTMNVPVSASRLALVLGRL